MGVMSFTNDVRENLEIEAPLPPLFLTFTCPAIMQFGSVSAFQSSLVADVICESSSVSLSFMGHKIGARLREQRVSSLSNEYVHCLRDADEACRYLPVR